MSSDDVVWSKNYTALQWRHNGRDSVSNHQLHDCVLNRWFRRRSKRTTKLRVTSLCAENSPGTGEFPAQMASNAENVSIRWRHHGKCPPAWRGEYTASNITMKYWNSNFARHWVAKFNTTFYWSWKEFLICLWNKSELIYPCHIYDFMCFVL